MEKTKSRINKLFRDSVIIIGITVFIIVLCEIALRILYPEKILGSKVAYEFNEDYLVSLKPNMKKKYVRSAKNGGEVIYWETNSDCFRGAELEEKPGYRIMIYGDSNIQARFSKRKNTFPVQVRKFLNQNGFNDVEVINAGVIGFGPDQSLIRFSKEVDKYKPDLVIFHIFADNDFGDLLRNQLYYLDAKGKLVKSTSPLIVDEFNADGYLNSIKKNFKELLLVRAAERYSENFENISTQRNNNEALQNCVDQHLKVCENEYLNYINSSSLIRVFSDHYDIDLAINPDEKSSILKKKLMEQVLLEARNLAEQKNVDFFILIQPSYIDLTSENAVFNFKYLQKYPKYARSNLSKFVFDICNNNQISALNLFDLFLQNEPNSLFYRGLNNHWNIKGQRISGKETAQFIMKNYNIRK